MEFTLHSTFPIALVRTGCIHFQTVPPRAKAAELEGFAWLDLVGKVQEMFPNVKTVTVGVGYYVVDNEDFVPYLAALRRAPGLQQLEEKGTVLFHMIPWETHRLAVRPLLQY